MDSFTPLLTVCECFNTIPFLLVSLCVYAFILIHVDQSSANRTTWQSEGIWYRTVKLTNDFIDSFLPAGVAVSPSPDG